MELSEIRKEQFNTNESLKEVEKIRQDILERGIVNVPEHQLADAVLTLSMYLVNIGQLFVDLGSIADDDEDEYKSGLNEEYLKLKEDAVNSGEKLSDKNAESMAFKNCSDLRKKSKTSRDKYNFVMRYYKDIERVVSTAQSKMRVGSSDMVRSNM